MIFRVHKLLTSYINIAEGENHPQPWEELNCEYLEPNTPPSSMDRIPGVIDRHSAPMHKQDDYMKRVLYSCLLYVSISGDLHVLIFYVRHRSQL